MAKIDVHITEENMLEWMHSVGYFLPRDEMEMNRFERLHSEVKRAVNDAAVDPVAILNGTWKPTAIKPIERQDLDNDIQELRMAARNSQGLPDDILQRIKENQKKNGKSDNPKG